MTKRRFLNFLFLSIFLCFLCLSICGSFFLDNISDMFNYIYRIFILEKFPFRDPNPLAPIDVTRYSFYLWLFNIFGSPTSFKFTLAEIANLLFCSFKYFALDISFIAFTIIIGLRQNKSASKKIALSFSIFAIILITINAIISLFQIVNIFEWWIPLYVINNLISNFCKYFFYAYELIKAFSNFLILISCFLSVFVTTISSKLKKSVKIILSLALSFVFLLIFIFLLASLFKTLITYFYMISFFSDVNFIRDIYDFLFFIEKNSFIYTLVFPDMVAGLDEFNYVLPYQFILLIPDIIFGLIVLCSVGIIGYLFIKTILENKKGKKLSSLAFVLPLLIPIIFNLSVIIIKIIIIVTKVTYIK